MKVGNQFLSKLQFFTLILILFAGINTAQAAPCTNNNWQPTFVHDLDNPDGPWYVTPNGQFIKVQIVNNQDWTPHVCDLINQYGVRDYTGYTNCQNHTRVQCGCKRGLSEGNSTCANFLSGHNKKSLTLTYSNEEMVPLPATQFSYNHCPKRNPGQKSWNKYPPNNNETYLTCSYFKDGGLEKEIHYENRKKHGVELHYKSESLHRLGFRTTYQNGKKHGRMEQWAIDRKTGKHFMQFKSRYANNKRVGIHCKYKPNGSIENWMDSNNSKNRCLSSQSCADRCRDY